MQGFNNIAVESQKASMCMVKHSEKTVYGYLEKMIINSMVQILQIFYETNNKNNKNKITHGNMITQTNASKAYINMFT